MPGINRTKVVNQALRAIGAGQINLSGSSSTPINTVAAAISAGASYTLPDSVGYTVGNKRLRVYLGGVRCNSGESGYYSEVGDPGSLSTTITVQVDTPAGWEIMAEVI